MAKFKIGDIVQLKSGYESTKEFVVSEVLGNNYIKVIWFDSKEEKFNEALLHEDVFVISTPL